LAEADIVKPVGVAPVPTVSSAVFRFDVVEEAALGVVHPSVTVFPATDVIDKI
jgi:hypothetical protein